MMVQPAEWLIDLLGLLSGVLLGNRHRAGWLLSIATQTVWCAVATATGQWAFVVASVVYAAVAVRGWVVWRRTERPELFVVSTREVTEDELAALRARWARYESARPGLFLEGSMTAVADD